MSMLNPDDQTFMDEALKQAKRAKQQEEVPVGAVVTRSNRIIARAHNRVEQLQDATAHAEMIALTRASEETGDWRLSDCTLYVTLEPCPMCAGALVQSRIHRLVYGAEDPEGGACGTLYNIVQDHRLNHRVEMKRGVRAEASSKLLETFFSEQRDN